MTLTPGQREALAQLATLWRDRPFVLIGASALQLQVPLQRATRDLDITLAADLDEFPAGLDYLEGWSRHPRLEHEWHGPSGVRVDVLPAGATLRSRGFVEWGGGVRMSLAGFRLVFQHTLPLAVTADVSVAVARAHVIAFLKMTSYLDRPHERGRDLGDIALLLEHYIDDDDDRRWSDGVIAAGPPFEDVPAFLLGADLREILDDAEREVVERFLVTVSAEPTRGAMLVRAPRSWTRASDVCDRRLASFRAGLGD